MTNVQALADQLIAAGLVPEAQAEIARLTRERAIDAPSATRIAKPVLPPSLLDEFRQFRGANDYHQWELGERVEAAVIEFAGQYPQGVIEAAAAKEAEWSVALVRKCRATWANTTLYLRETFYGPLTFEHFAALRYQAVESMAQYLTWCVESADDFGGKPAPAAVLKRKLREDSGTPTPPADPHRDAERAATLLTRALGAAGVAAATRAKWQSALDALEGA